MSPERGRTVALAALVLAMLPFGACSLPPLRGRAEVGRDAYAIFVADSPDGADLFAVLASGGAPIPLTFTVVDERAPVLSPDGGTVAFIRDQRIGRDEGSGRDSVRTTVWVTNLLSGADRELVLPGMARADAVAWSRDGRNVYVRSDRGTYRVQAPPARASVQRVTPAEQPAADSSFFVLVGEPAFGRATACDSAVCLVGADGTPSRIAEHAREPLRWGRDSLAYFRGTDVVVRPLGPGRPRSLRWEPAPIRPRGMTFFAGRSDSATR